MNCDDCKGSGQVPLGFYAGFPQGIGANPQTEPCRKCQGRRPTGGVWLKAVLTTLVTVALVERFWRG